MKADGQRSDDVSTCSGIRGAQPGTEVCCKAGALPRSLPRAGIPGEILLGLFVELTLWRVAPGGKGGLPTECNCPFLVN